MVQKYKEIVFGVVFGIAAMVIDTAMDASTEGRSLANELASHPGMIVYRLGFVLLGLILGWLLWRNHKRERELRQMAENFRRLQQQCSTNGLLLRSTLQLVLTRDDLHLSEEARRLVYDAFQKTEALQGFAEEKTPAASGASHR
jgi:hypothetical protein